MNQQNILSGELPEAAFGRSHSLSWKGIAWAAALPGLGLLLFYSLEFDTRLALGRWPIFGEQLPTRFLSLHNTLACDVYGALFFSLYVVPLLLIGSLCFRKTRHLSAYILTYAGCVVLAGLVMRLSPHPFLNWFFD